MKYYKTLDYRSRGMPNLDFVEKGLGLASPPYFVYDFSRKIFFMLYSINRPNFIVWLPIGLRILGNMCIPVVFYRGCGVINFVINLIFLIKLFFYLIEKSRKTFKYFEYEKGFRKEKRTWNKKYFSSFLNGFQLPEILSNRRVHL